MGRRRSQNLHLPSGVYHSRGSYFWRDPSTGKWHPLGQKWDREARAKWAEFSTGKAKDGTVAQLLDSFLKHCEGVVRAGKRSHDTHTVNELEAVQLKAFFGRMHYLDVTGKHCASYLKKRKDKHGRLVPVRANREIAFLSSAYSWAMGEDNYEVQVNPCYGVRRNPEEPRKRYVDTGELRRFTRGVRQADGSMKVYVPRWVRCYALLKRLTALPQSDMLDLDDSHITERGIVYIRNKTARTDGVPVIYRWTWALRIVVASALAMRQPLPENVQPLAPRPLFPSRYGTRRSRQGFKTAWQIGMVEYAKDGFKRFWEHDIRAKVASDADDIEHARKMLNHATQATTKRYRRGPRLVSPAR